MMSRLLQNDYYSNHSSNCCVSNLAPFQFDVKNIFLHEDLKKKKKYTCDFLPTIQLLIMVLLLDCVVLYMVWNKLLKLGLRNFEMHYSSLISARAWMILRCFSSFLSRDYGPSCLCGSYYYYYWYICRYDQRSSSFSSLIISYKRFGASNIFLGLKIHQSKKGLVLHQHKYTLDLIEMAGLVNSTLVDTYL